MAKATVHDLNEKRDAKKLDNAAEKIRVELQRKHRCKERIGEFLTEVEPILKKNGYWMQWLEKEFAEQYSFSSATAYRYLEIYKQSQGSSISDCKVAASKGTDRSSRSSGGGGPSKGSRGARHTGAAKGGQLVASALAVTPPSGAVDHPSQESAAPPSQAGKTDWAAYLAHLPLEAIVTRFLKSTPAIVH